jgi:hypothetical protein
MRAMGEARVAFGSFSQFHPFYLSQHANRTCRRVDFAGTSLGPAALLHAFAMLAGKIRF